MSATYVSTTYDGCQSAFSGQGSSGLAALEQDAKDLNLIASFVGMRDVPELTAQAVEEKLGGPADIAVLFGGGGPATADALAAAMKAGVAIHYVIAGGHGHTTARVYEALSARLPQGAISPEASEAEMLDAYLRYHYGLSADLLEKESTNCGYNIINLLALLDERGIDASRFVLIHDMPFQRRISATMELEAPEASWVNFAAWQAKVGVRDGQLVYLEAPEAMWWLEHYRSLLLGKCSGSGTRRRATDLAAAASWPMWRCLMKSSPPTSAFALAILRGRARRSRERG